MSGEEEHQAEGTASGETVEPLRAHLSLNLQPPTNLDLSDNHRAENWKTFKQCWNHYSILTQLDRQPEEYKVALFLYSVGNEAVKSLNTFDLTDAEKGNLKAIIAAFDKFAVGEKNETYGRYKFNSRDQRDESVSAYITELRTLAQTCNFCTCLNDSLIRDGIVLGVKCNEIRKRLLQRKKVSLSECVDMCLASEVTKTQLKDLDKQEQQETVHEIKQAKNIRRRRDKPNRPVTKQFTANRNSRPCRYCGEIHKAGRDHCPAWGKFCSACGYEESFCRCLPAREQSKSTNPLCFRKHSLHGMRDCEARGREWSR